MMMPRFWAIGIVMETIEERTVYEEKGRSLLLHDICWRHCPLIHGNMLGRQIVSRGVQGRGLHCQHEPEICHYRWHPSLYGIAWKILGDQQSQGSKNHDWVLQWREAWKKRGSGLWDRGGATTEAKKNKMMWNLRQKLILETGWDWLCHIAAQLLSAEGPPSAVWAWHLRSSGVRAEPEGV